MYSPIFKSLGNLLLGPRDQDTNFKCGQLEGEGPAYWNFHLWGYIMRKMRGIVFHKKKKEL